MRVKIIGFTMLGIGLALAGGLGTFYYTRAIENELAAARLSLRAFGDTVEIPVPNRDLPLGSLVTAADFKLAQLPQSFLPKDILRSLPALPEAGSLVAMNDLRAEEMLSESDLALQDQEPQFGMTPALNNRIFAVALRNLAELRPELETGARVDLVWSQDLGSGQTESRLAATGLILRKLGPDAAPLTEVPAADASPLAGMALLEGDQTDALRLITAGQKGGFYLLISDGSRSLATSEVVIGASELSSLPLVLRDSGNAPAAGSAVLTEQAGFMGKITGQETRKRCTTALIKGGNRSMAEVPC